MTAGTAAGRPCGRWAALWLGTALAAIPAAAVWAQTPLQPLPPDAVLLQALPGQAAPAQAAPHQVAPPQGGPLHATLRGRAGLTIDTDKAQLVTLPEPAKTVFVANPDIADIQVPTPSSFLVYGKKPGTTSVFAIGDSGATTSYTVHVTRPIGEVSMAVHNAAPGAAIRVSATPDGILISGSVDSPRDAEKIKAAAQQFLGDKETLDFEVAVKEAAQVTLHVKVAEVSRNIDKQFGVNWGAIFNSNSLVVGLLTGRTTLSAVTPFVPSPATGTFPTVASGSFGSIGAATTAEGGKINVSTIVDALDQSGLATILAEPTLTAVSGETANFLSGGEYPIPVPQGLQTVTVEYKRYGVSVDFTPTVLDHDRISIKVRPEVSALTSVGALVLDGVSVPALTVRRAETTVELGSGESFAIAGLFQNNGQNQIQQFPWLGDIPILGALFRSSTYQRNESELVIIVTPYIVRPVADQAELHVPTEGVRYSSDLELILDGRLTAADRRPTASPVAAPYMGPITGPTEPRLHGPAGFMVE